MAGMRANLKMQLQRDQVGAVYKIDYGVFCIHHIYVLGHACLQITPLCLVQKVVQYCF